MRSKNRQFFKQVCAGLMLLCLMAVPPSAVAALGSPDPNQSGSMGLEATISALAPTQAATVFTPSQGQTFTETPITVAGSCKTGLLVKIFSNNVFVGSVVCTAGSYSLKVDLFNGQNDIVARVYDSLDQSGPDSNVISVRFNDAQYAEFGSRVSLSSPYARKGASPGTELVWPLVLSGGKGPYAVSVEWGDGKGSTLYSESFAGTFNISHIYDAAGVYNVVVKATDGNGTNAYLQLVGIATGQAGTSNTSSSSASNGGPTTSGKDTFIAKYGWYLLLAAFPFMLITFWLGTRHELFTIRRRIERSRQQA